METNPTPLPFEDADWFSWDDEEHDGGWLLSYVDVLCVVLAMMVVLLGHLMAQRRGTPPTSPPARVVQAASAPTPKPVIPPVAAPAAVPLPAKAKPITKATAAPAVVAPKPMATGKGSETKPVAAAAKKAKPSPSPTRHTAAAPVIKPTPSPQARLIEEVRSRFAGQITAVRHDRGVSLRIADVILFDSARANLRKSARPVLRQLVGTLRELGKVTITVAGYTDNQPVVGGRFRNNWELGAARANAVVEFLIRAGFDPAKLRSVSYADTRPVASNATAEGRAKNRRVELRVKFAAATKAD